jgi:hypothetical protein
MLSLINNREYKTKRFFNILAIVLTFAFLSGCASKIPHMVVSDYAKRGLRLVAVMPVSNKTSDDKAASMLRGKILDAMYLKGYPKIPFGIIGERIAKVDKASLSDVKILGGVLGVDALMFVTLEESYRSVTLLFASTALSAVFQMRDVKTGEVLWETKYSTGERNFDITRKRVDLKSVQVFEPLMQQIVDKVMETLPDGPDL